MEGLTRLVSESLARHGFDRPLDYRRLHWSRWFRCESHHSLLFVPSKPGVFALAEEITHLAANAKPALSAVEGAVPRSGASASTRDQSAPMVDVRKSDDAPARMLAVTQFFEADDMAFVLDRMLSRQNPMRAQLESGRYFVRFVVIEDVSQRRSIASALNQWMVSSSERATGIGSHFATSLELTPATEFIPRDENQGTLFDETNAIRPLRPTLVERTIPFADAANSSISKQIGASAASPSTAQPLDSGAATNIHCPSPFPSGF
jgi:hypothetical protein